MKFCFYLLAGMAAVGLAACSGPEDRPVTEKLTPEQTAKIITADSDKAPWIERLAGLRDMNETEFEEFNDVTYSRYFDYKRRCADNDERWRTEARQEYDRRYAPVIARADSVFRYWQQWEVDHRLQNLIKVTPTALRRDDDGSIYVSFRINSALGQMQSVDLGIKLSKWVRKLTYGLWLPDIKGEVIDHPFAEAEINDLRIYPRTGWTDSEEDMLRLKNDAPTGFHDVILEDLNRLSVDAFVDKYGLSIEPGQVQINGKNLFADSHKFDMPEAIRHFWIPSAKPAHDGIARFEDMKDIIVHEILHENIPAEHEFVSDYVDGKQCEIDLRAHDLDNIKFRIL